MRFLLLLIACAFPLGQEADSPVLIAHRGNSSEAPENTLAAVRAALALERPGEFVEIDVHASADGRLVVLHDPTLERTTTGRGKVDELPWEEIRRHRASYPEKFGEAFADEPIPHLAQVLDLAKDAGVGVMIEVKAHGVGQAVVRLLEQRGELERHVVASFYADVLVAASMAHGSVRTLYLFGRAVAEEVELARRIGAQVIGVDQAQLTREIVEAAHAKGLVVWSWTVNEPERAATLLGWGVDGIISDRPRAMRQLEGWR